MTVVRWFCERPLQKHLSQIYLSFKNIKAIKYALCFKKCFITIHKILMFAISHAACQTLHALIKTLNVRDKIPYIERVFLLDVMENTHS